MRITGVLLVFFSIAPAIAQSPPAPPKDLPPTKSTMRDTERAIVVEGCIWGNRLKIDKDHGSLTVRLLDVSEFVLEGPKETLQRLKTDHDGHQDEISGIVIIPASQTDPAEVTTKEIGKRTRVFGGTSGTGPTQGSGQAFKPLRLKFGSVRHLAEKCSIPG